MPKPTIEPLAAPTFTVPTTGANTGDANRKPNSDSHQGSDVVSTSYLSNPVQVEKADAVQKQKETNAMYTNKQQQQDLDTHTGRQNQIVDDFAMTPEQWYKMYGYWNWNLAKDNPNGNLNNRTYGQTLSASRLADALNNKRHWKPTDIGYRTSGIAGTQALQRGYSERWEPIETQETRQMRANEAMDIAARQRQVNRAENIQDYPLELQKLSDHTRSELTKYASQTGIDLQRAMQASKWKAEYGDSWQTYWTNSVTEFTRELDLRIKEKVYSKLVNLEYPFRQAWAALNGGAAFNPVEQAMWQNITSATAGISDPAVKSAIMMFTATELAGMGFKQAGEGFKEGLTN